MQTKLFFQLNFTWNVSGSAGSMCNETRWYVSFVSSISLRCRVAAIYYIALQKYSADPSKIIASRYNKHKNVKLVYQKDKHTPSCK